MRTRTYLHPSYPQRPNGLIFCISFTIEAGLTRDNFPCNLSCRVGKKNPLQVAADVVHGYGLVLHLAMSIVSKSCFVEIFHCSKVLPFTPLKAILANPGTLFSNSSGAMLLGRYKPTKVWATAPLDLL